VADLFAFDDADFRPIAGFSLLWRWTSASHAEFPQDVLDRIRPIAPAKAAAINDFVIERVEATWPALGLDPELATDVQRLETTHADETAVSDWLTALPLRADEDVVVSWDKDTAVVAPFAIVAAYWSDFFYPSSDDAIVIPPNLEWMLAWDHHEAFQFGLPRHPSRGRAG
jgi:hypothetical protein